MDEIEGAPGELIDRLVAVMNSDELGELGWYSVGFYEYFVGAQAALAIDATSALGPADRRDPAGRRFREMALAATS